MRILVAWLGKPSEVGLYGSMAIRSFLFFIICVSTFLALTLRAAEKPYIISGFDDVLRQAENTGLMKASLKIIEADKSFAGMCELYSIISDGEADPAFALVSGISSWFDGRVDRLLTENRCPSNQRFLRNWLTQWSIAEFKMAALKKTIQSRPSRQFIVIFDNSDASLELADRIHETYPIQVVAIYLRQVVEKKTPVNAKPFFTSFDIALNEYRSGRMSAADAIRVGETLVSEKEGTHIFPSYAICNGGGNLCTDVDKKLSEVCLKVNRHLQQLCAEHIK